MLAGQLPAAAVGPGPVGAVGDLSPRCRGASAPIIASVLIGHPLTPLLAGGPTVTLRTLGATLIGLALFPTLRGL